MSELDRFDPIIDKIRAGSDYIYWKLSTSERLFIALAANRADLLKEESESIASALVQIGEAWREELVRRYQYT